MGNIAKYLSLIVRIDDKELQTLGRSRLFFSNEVKSIEPPERVEGLANIYENIAIIRNGIIRGPSHYTMRPHRYFGGTWGRHEILETTDES